ncbi:hypothetical protein CFN78_23950 [Amycolatopsis antarctica]|uniref:Uncharacterized protein n=1 Tax=Amycolatopsis antarctica TaxID=1854586 RepID=A0A263CX50_9PSEU|nr:hypothetical protein [Amycolatopsis antarctica]OZM70723.1 hypothetical protein CFN78_23950 [Amycolatopsis antarctica]
MTRAPSFDTAEPTTGLRSRAEGAGVDLASWWALRRAARGGLRHHVGELFTDGGRAVPEWIAQAYADLLASGHLADDADRPLTLTASGSAALAGGQP